MPTNNPPIFDGHNDSLESFLALNRAPRDFLIKNTEGHMDWPRAEAGGFNGGLFAIFVPPVMTMKPDPDMDEAQHINPAIYQPVDFSHAREWTQKGMESLFSLAADSQGRLRVIREIRALEKALQERVIAAVMHFEGAETIDPKLKNLETYYKDGLRSLGLVWSRPNAFGCGVPFTPNTSPDQGPGLTVAGKELVKACNRLGILVDLSHLNEKGFWDVEKTTSAPLVASHSCVYSLSPSPRNLLDKQLEAIAASGGLVGINFAVGFLRPDNKRDADTPLSVLVRHFTYVAEKFGVDHVALGSDFDGATIPKEIGDVSGLPKLLDALRGAGFNEEDLAKIAYQNWLRVLTDTWK
ncbi:MAG: membrane dipeptidase [Desulfobacteraceae bacterium]|nr:MAG: membrane dipeptidase [Desulfobacteraceae bacterium]